MDDLARCGSEHASVPESEIRLMAAVSAEWGDLETGGMLVGLWTHGGRPIVFSALPPAPDATHETAHFADDPEHFRRTSALLYESFGVQAVGTWHSHHRLGLNEPSSGDVEQVRSITERNGIQRWVEIITTHDGELCGERCDDGHRHDRWSRRPRGGADAANVVKINCFLYPCAPTGERIRCAIRIIPGVSPLRQALIGSNYLSDSALGYQGWTFPMERIRYDRLDETSLGESAETELHPELVKQIGDLPPAARQGMTVSAHDGLVVVTLPTVADLSALVAYTATDPFRPHAVRLADLHRGTSRDVTTALLGPENGVRLLDLYETLLHLPADEPCKPLHEDEVSTGSEEGRKCSTKPRHASQRHGRWSQRSPAKRR